MITIGGIIMASIPEAAPQAIVTSEAVKSSIITRRAAPEGADPEFPVPPNVECLRTAAAKSASGADPSAEENSVAAASAGNGDHSVDEAEFMWMEARRPLSVPCTGESLAKDYGPDAGAAMASALASLGLGRLLGVFNWPGVGSRHGAFASWCQSELAARGNGSPHLVGPAAALRGFGRSLGRVTTYRALSLNPEARAHSH